MQITATTSPAQVRQFIAAMTAIGAAHERGIAFALNGVAKDAQKRLTEMLRREIDQPTPFTLKAITTTLIDMRAQPTQRVRDMVASVDVQPIQSAYLKYLRGEGVNEREPGDIGPADQFIYVPIWGNLARQGIRAKNGANMPRNTLQKLATKAGRSLGGGAPPPPPATGRRRRPSAKGSIFWGAPVIKGQRQGLGFWWRPPRGQGAPDMLVAAADKSMHRPMLERPWEQAIEGAWGTFAGRLENELREKTEHLARRRAAAAGGGAT